MPAPPIIILVLVALLVLVSALGPRVAGFIVWGRKVNPARLLAAGPRGPREDPVSG